MAIDINGMDVNKVLFESLQDAFGDFKEAPAEQASANLMTRSKRYVQGEKTKVAFESLTVTTMYDVEIRNVKNREELDLSNSFVTMLMPANTLPLPIYACDIDVHKGKYVHVITDLLPLSRDPAYLIKYDEPLQGLRNKYADLPGIVREVPDELYKVFPALKQFEAFASSGKIIGNIPIAYGPQIIELVKDYVKMYCAFAKESPNAAILQRDDIQKQAVATKHNFLQMMSQLDFSDDMPNQPRSSG